MGTALRQNNPLWRSKKRKRGIRDPLSDRVLHGFSYVLSVLWLIGLLFPIFWMVTGALKDSATNQAFPPVWLPRAPRAYTVQLNYDGYAKDHTRAELQKAIREDTAQVIECNLDRYAAQGMSYMAIEAYRSNKRIAQAGLSWPTFGYKKSYIFISPYIYPFHVKDRMNEIWQLGGIDWKSDLNGKLGNMVRLTPTTALDKTVTEFLPTLPLNGKVIGEGSRDHWQGLLDNFVSAVAPSGVAPPPVNFSWFIGNSAQVAFFDILGQFMVSAMAAYALSRLLKRKVMRFWLMFFLVTMMVPFVVSMQPSFRLIEQLGLYGSLWGVILFNVPNAFFIYLFKGFFDALPGDLFDAARIDGASELSIFRLVAIPNASSVFAVIGLFTFFGSWNNFFWPFLVLRQPANYTFPIALYMLTNGSSDAGVGVGLAQGLLASIPTLIGVSVFGQYIRQGLVFSGIKG